MIYPGRNYDWTWATDENGKREPDLYHKYEKETLLYDTALLPEVRKIPGYEAADVNNQENCELFGAVWKEL